MNTLPHTIETIKPTEQVALHKPKKDYVFMKGLNFYKLFWIFMTGSFFGVIVETIYCILKNGYYQNRVGVIWGPFNPVYGIGAILIVLFVIKVKKNYLCVFFGSMIIGGSFEYLCSLFQELIFGTVSWEYSHTPMNIAGRTNLLYSFFWGILGLFFVRDIMPRIDKILDRISGKAAFIITWVMIVFMTVNMFISFLAVDRWQQRIKGTQSPNIVFSYTDKLFPDDYMQGKYPNMMVVDKTSQQMN